MNKLLSNIRHSMSANLSVGILLMAIPVFILALGILFLQSRYFIRKELPTTSAACLIRRPIMLSTT